MTLAAIAREMGISVSYASALLSDPTGEIALARKRSHYKRTSKRKKKPSKWTEETIIEAIQEWEIIYGRPPTCPEWSRRDGLPEWAPTVGVVFRVFGKGGWNKAIASAGFTPRPAHGPDWTHSHDSPSPINPEVKEAMSKRQKALYEADPDHPLKRGHQLSRQKRKVRQR